MAERSKPTLMVIDGHSLVFRAFFALPVESFTTRDGQHTNGIHGFLSMLLLLLQNENPSHLAVAFDLSRTSFRTRDYAEYKSTRSETPPELIGQVPLLQECLAAMNIPILVKENYEADDILATLARRATEAGYRVLVVSGDRDSIQLVNDDVTLLYPSTRGVSELKRYTPETVRERYGVEPRQYPEIAALVGEKSDNLPGIDKVGEKTAVKWITEYGSLENLLDHMDEIGGVVGAKLREQHENARRNRRLNRLVDDLDLEVNLDDLVRRRIDVERVREVFGRLQFRTLMERLLKIEGLEAGAAPADLSVAGAVQGLTAPAPLSLSDEALGVWLTNASESPVALQIQTLGGELIGFGLATESESVYVPWGPAHPDGAADASGNAATLDLEHWLASGSAKWMLDAKPQWKALARAGLTLNGIAADARIASWLHAPSTPGGDLARLAFDLLGVELPQPDPNQLVPEEDGLGPADEAWYLHRVTAAALDELDDGSRRVHDEIEIPLIPVIGAMEFAGVAVDRDALVAQSAELADRAAAVAGDAFASIGHEVNLGSPKQLQQVLFEELQLPKTRSTKTGHSTDADAIADLAVQSDHPFLGHLLAHRDVVKLRQIIESLVAAIGPDHRIHTTYQQTGAVTGRLSSNDPNLQNIPVKTEEGRRIRSAFQAGDGYPLLLTADYSQIEMRIMAHLSGDAGLIEAFNSGEDLHRFVGARVFGVAPEAVTPQMRTKVKAMSYGLAYGLSAFGLSKQLRIETAEAKQLMADYFVRFGGVRDYLRHVVEQARVDGYTTTIFGRRRPFPDLNSRNRVLRDNAERQALNAPIQGSAADIIKIAMRDVAADIIAQRLVSRMLMQVHDELVFEVAEGEMDAVSSIVIARMRGAAQLSVPLDVQVGVGRDWDSAAH